MPITVHCSCCNKVGKPGAASARWFEWHWVRIGQAGHSRKMIHTATPKHLQRDKAQIHCMYSQLPTRSMHSNQIHMHLDPNA